MYTRQILPIFVLVLSLAPLLAQSGLTGRIADFNHDGVVDTLIFHDDPVPCHYDFLAVFIDGKTKTQSGVPREEYCRCHIRSLLPIPPVLQRPENAEVLEIIKTKLLPEERLQPDASFSWILSGLANRRRMTDQPHFDLVVSPDLEKLPGKVDLPDTYSVPVSDEAFGNLLQGSFFDGPVACDQGNAIYYGHNHYQRRNPRADSVVLVATTAELDIYRTSHGLFAQSPTDHHWLFVTDHALTGAPDKLRWASIGDVAVWDGRLLILQHRRPVSSGSAVFLIDLASGRVGRLRRGLVGEPDDRITFMVKDDCLNLKATMLGEIEREEVDLVLSLKALLSELGQL